MPENSKRKRAAEAYKALIDDFVKQAKEFGHAAHVEGAGIYSKAPAHSRFNAFIQGLSSDERSLVADMLRTERRGAIHDLLARLTWWMECQELVLSHGKTPMPVDLSGMGLHGDFVGRMGDWEWPADSKPD